MLLILSVNFLKNFPGIFFSNNVGFWQSGLSFSTYPTCCQYLNDELRNLLFGLHYAWLYEVPRKIMLNAPIKWWPQEPTFPTPISSNFYNVEFLQHRVFFWLGIFLPGDSATSNFFNVRISPTLIFPLTWSFSPEDSVTSNFPDGKCLQCWILLWLGVFSLRNFVASNFSDVEFLHPLTWSFLTWRFSNL